MKSKEFSQSKTIISSFILGGILIGALTVFMGYEIELSIILIGSGIFIFGVTYFLYKDILNPVGLFSLIWLGAIGLSNLHLSPLQSKWTGKLWLILLTGYFGFLIGNFLATVPLYLKDKFNSQVPLDNEIDFLKVHISKSRLEKLIISLFIISSIAYLYEAYNIGGLPIFSEKPLQSYVQFAMPKIHFLAVIMIPLCSLIGLYFALYERPSWMKLTLGVIFFFLVARLARWELIWGIIGFLVPNHYLNKRLKPRHFLIFFSIIMSFITILGVLRTLYVLEGWNYINVIYGLNLSPSYIGFSWIYVYFASSIENLNEEMLALGNNYTFGLYTLRPLLAIIGKKDIIPKHFTPELLEGWTGTFLLSFYSDFGLVGALIFPFIIGFFTSRIHFLSIKHNRNRVFWIMLYSMLVVPILSVGSNDMFTEVTIYFFIIVLSLAYFYIKV